MTSQFNSSEDAFAGPEPGTASRGSGRPTDNDICDVTARLRELLGKAQQAEMFNVAQKLREAMEAARAA
jgi:hypothetical protein